MIKTFRFVSCCAIFFLSFLCSSLVRADIAVVVNTRAETRAITVDELKSIYLGKVRTFPNGNSAILSINTSKGLGDEFLRRVVDKTQSQFDSYWNVRLFTAKGNLPYALSSDEEVKDWLSTHVNGIGFVRKSSMNPEEKRVKIILLLAQKDLDS